MFLLDFENSYIVIYFETARRTNAPIDEYQEVRFKTYQNIAEQSLNINDICYIAKSLLGGSYLNLNALNI